MGKRRQSTVVRDNFVHSIYKRIMDELGELGAVVSRTYIYERMSNETKLSVRTISFIINHTKPIISF